MRCHPCRWVFLFLGLLSANCLDPVGTVAQQPVDDPPASGAGVQDGKDQANVSNRHRDRFERHRPIKIEAVELNTLSGKIDNDRIRARFLGAGRSLIQSPMALSDQQILALIKERTSPSSVSMPQLPCRTKITYQDIAKASLLFGSIYDCGRCNNIHENVAGGVVISRDGLAVTNYHVLEQEYGGTLAVFGMTYEGTPRPVLDVLYANELADVALIRLGGDTPFYPVPIAEAMPMPLDPVTVLSNPKNNFFVLTTGVVNRHVSFVGRKGVEENWMEVTAEYAAGSSGSGVFDAKGALIGLVSSNTPLPRIMSHREPGRKSGRPDSDTYYEMTLRRCVTAEAIRACFATTAADQN